jgi:hypothetical protein
MQNVHNDTSEFSMTDLGSPTRMFSFQPITDIIPIYADWLERISESPASNTAMVEHLKSLPQAVPSSIYKMEKVSKVNTLQSLERLYRWVESSQTRRSDRRTSCRQTKYALCTYVCSREVVNLGLGQHRVVLEFTLAERRGVSGDDDELGLARAELLEGRLISEGN